MRNALLLALGLSLPVAAHADAPVVLADVPPVQSLVAQVMDGVGTPELLITGEAHDFQMKPSQARALTNAGAVFWVGPVLTPALVGPMRDAGQTVVTLEDSPGVTMRNASLSDQPDPHMWTDPGNAAAMVRAIAATLAKADPGHAATYDANRDRALKGLDALTTRTAAALAPVKGMRLIVAHDALAHFAARFGLDVVGTLTDPGSEDPSARRVADLTDLIRQGGVDCVLTQGGHVEAAARQLAQDGDLPLAVIDPEGADEAPGPGLYDALIDSLAASIASCATH